tara:strand:- start:4856 stop:5083 length:228 start_codon:yes stop_codon:yes gene_type:complete
MTNHYKSGEANPRTRHSDQIVRRARLIYARGYTQQETRQHLADEGIEVDRYTLSGWLHWHSRVDAGGALREGVAA